MAQADCKHEGQDGDFCSKCGKQIKEDEIDKLATKIVAKLKEASEPSGKEPEYENELDRVLRRKKKK